MTASIFIEIHRLTPIQVLDILEERRYLDAQTVTDLGAVLAEREKVPLPEDQDWSIPRRIIEQRIEEDRERHKRIKDAEWITSPEGNDEFEAMWERTEAKLEPSDLEEIKRQAEDRQVREEIVARFLPDPSTVASRDGDGEKMEWEANGETNGKTPS
jgi:hypothetical protein